MWQIVTENILNSYLNEEVTMVINLRNKYLLKRQVPNKEAKTNNYKVEETPEALQRKLIDIKKKKGHASDCSINPISKIEDDKKRQTTIGVFPNNVSGKEKENYLKVFPYEQLRFVKIEWENRE